MNMTALGNYSNDPVDLDPELPLTNDDERHVEVARRTDRARGPPGHGNATPAADRDGALGNSDLGGKTKKSQRTNRTKQPAKQESLQSIYDGQELLGYCRGGLALDAAGHELGCFRNRAQAVLRVLDNGRLASRDREGAR